MNAFTLEITTGDGVETLAPPTDKEWAQWLEDEVIDEDSIRPTEPQTYHYFWADVIGDGRQAHYVVRHQPVVMENYPELVGVYERMAVTHAVDLWLKETP